MNMLLKEIESMTTRGQREKLAQLVQFKNAFPEIEEDTTVSQSLLLNPYEHWNNKLLPSNYIIENGYLSRIIDRNGTSEYKPIANFIASVTKEITKDNGNECNIYQMIEGRLIDGVKMPTITIPADLFSGLAWVQNHWGIRAIIEPGTSNKDLVRHAIQILSSDCEKESIFSHIGWRKINGRWVYLHADGGIGLQNVKVELESDSLNKYALAAPSPNISEAVSATLKLLEVADQNVTIPLLSLIGLTPLCEPLKMAGIMPSFVLWLVGPSGVRKSTLAACFLSHFGSFLSGKDLPASFKDTANAIEKKAFLTKDSLLVIDDFHPTLTAYEGQRMEQTAQMILRGYGDRVGRSRLQADAALRATFPPRGMCLVTGEDTPKAGNSTTARFLPIEIKKGSINLDILSKCQEDSYKYKITMAAYLEWLAPRIDEISEQLNERFKEIRLISFQTISHGRTTEALAWLQLGLETFLSFLKEKDFIDNIFYEALLSDAELCFKRLGDNQMNSLQQDNPTKLFLLALDQLIESKSVQLLSSRNDPIPNGAVKYIGWQDNDYYYLLPGMTYKEIYRFYSEQGLNLSIGNSMLLKMLAEDGFIVTEQTQKGTRYTVRSYIAGKQQRVIKLKKNAVLDFE
ncbi:hypothetical protein [Neobacillus drentensis]|uniref:hypothetical protein n=1 Tax=Neobacillus drentensis TaxID=220684 RepID=UPI003000F6C6